MKAPIDILGLSNGARSGLTGFVAGLARKVARHNVTINNLLPGSFDTDRLRSNDASAREGAGQALEDAARTAARDAIPAGRFGNRRRVRRGLRVPVQRARGLHRRPEHAASTAATTRARSDACQSGRLRMIDLYYWTTPNGHKVTIFLEETGLPYTVKPINISKGEQFDAGVSRDLAEQPHPGASSITRPPDGGAPLSMMESGAILLYLAGKTGRLLSGRPARPRANVVQWLFWQMGGPRADGRAEPSFPRCTRPRRFRTRSTATCARPAGCTRCSTSGSPTASSSRATIRSPTWPAIRGCSRSGRSRTSTSFPHLARWLDAIAARPAVERAYAIAKTINVKPAVDDEKSRAILFGQSKDTVR